MAPDKAVKPRDCPYEVGYKGIHSLYLYCSTSQFGAPFAMHKEDMGLALVNYLH